ncbi:uncharacterized protein RMCC_1802 [Mycolicibacterium canariasense]|jgi:hypothetical protein|uniref:Uncharacterized protein n=2 Tax=Mycobacteriaceae TaxID=1762 RepID=A0A100WAY6_MYCCR|nr:hypothetical protein [Mycolicibacterium mageritense]MCV7211500.1 hypothetical protein [Mycolicibacterium canariasense]ORV10527.1 hypothetical protein AWB94_07470 [Mycolicibacterium canariasense]GAS94836.1 uncharacterized protein RMCC_1802 [Mycolicibacterium canariasense]
MLSDWEACPLQPGQVADMSPRHAPEIRFRPHTVSARRDASGAVVVLRISGNRLPPRGGLPMAGTLDSWEWDRTRDPAEDWLDAVIAGLDR